MAKRKKAAKKSTTKRKRKRTASKRATKSKRTTKRTTQKWGSHGKKLAASVQKWGSTANAEREYKAAKNHYHQLGEAVRKLHGG